MWKELLEDLEEERLSLGELKTTYQKAEETVNRLLKVQNDAYGEGREERLGDIKHDIKKTLGKIEEGKIPENYREEITDLIIDFEDIGYAPYFTEQFKEGFFIKDDRHPAKVFDEENLKKYHEYLKDWEEGEEIVSEENPIEFGEFIFNLARTVSEGRLYRKNITLEEILVDLYSGSEKGTEIIKREGKPIPEIMKEELKRTPYGGEFYISNIIVDSISDFIEGVPDVRREGGRPKGEVSYIA